jgi:two-component system sensor histidine kinase AtoS
VVLKETAVEPVNSLALFKATLLGAVLILALMLLVIYGMRKWRQGVKNDGDSVGMGAAGSNPAGANGEMSFVFNTFHQTLKEINDKKQELIQMHKDAEDRIRRMERYNECILESMVSGVMAFDREGKLTAMNEAAGAFMGWPKKVSPLGKGYEAILRGSDQLKEFLRRVLKGDGRVLREEIAYTFRSGELKWLGVNASPLKDDSGGMIGATLLFTDLTEVKELHRKVELKNRLAAMGEMSAGIAHEFRNSLGAILGYARLIDRQSGKNEILQESAEGIISEVKSFDAMLSDFLTFARPADLNKEACYLDDLVKEVLEVLAETIEKQQIRVTTHFDHAAPVHVDRTLIRQALTNLVKNALEAVRPGGEIRIGEHQVGQRAELRIEDDGCGISQELQKKIFEPFFTSKAEGTGLGLAITQKTVFSHQGSLMVESSEGKGTTVTLSLPVDENVA